MKALAPDLGLSNERTALSWQRTALSLITGAVIVGRLTIDRLGFAAIAIAAAAVLAGLCVLAESRWRYAQHRGERQRERPRGGRAAMSLSLATCLIAVAEIAALATT